MASSILNFNVGVLGHVDSGKTSLSKALSTVASTAAFDKNPQSKERGITLDLGFSSFAVPLPAHLASAECDYSDVQYTLVDCPGHASLMKTIIGGAAIVDLFMLVVDVTKGIQTQTAECLILGEILCSKMLVVLNKIDLIPPAKREAAIAKVSKKISKTLEATRFKGSRIVAVSANPGGGDANLNGLDDDRENDQTAKEGLGIGELISVLSSMTYVPNRSSEGAFVFAVDHCFALKGKGVILTGTCLHGRLAVGDNLEIPALKEVRKVKSMQMFKKPVDCVKQGDRAGICVTQFDSAKLERGVACTPSSMPLTFAAVVDARKIPHFKSDVKTGSKLHVSIGHETQVGKLSFFGSVGGDTASGGGVDVDKAIGGLTLDEEFDWSKDYVHLESLGDDGGSSLGSAPDVIDNADSTPGAAASGVVPSGAVASGVASGVLPLLRRFALVEFDHPICILANSLVIGSKLDADIHQNSCRIAFSGRVLRLLQDKDYAANDLPRLKVFKAKRKEGIVERMTDPYTIIAKGLFRKESKIDAFVNLRVLLSLAGEVGIIEGSFGQSGKFKIRIPEGLKEESQAALSETTAGKKKGKKEDSASATAPPAEKRESIKVILEFKKYVYGDKKKIVQ